MLFQKGYEDGFSGLKRNNTYSSSLYDSGYDLGREDSLAYETEVLSDYTESNRYDTEREGSRRR